VTITDRGRPVARLIGVDAITPGMQQLIAEGLLRMPKRPATSAASWPRPTSKGSVADLVAEQRR
jgi:antitoxin (DNA-binding transcriptional repressor) of toxin-antitoxin stability system